MNGINNLINFLRFIFSDYHYRSTTLPACSVGFQLPDHDSIIAIICFFAVIVGAVSLAYATKKHFVWCFPLYSLFVLYDMAQPDLFRECQCHPYPIKLTDTGNYFHEKYCMNGRPILLRDNTPIYKDPYIETLENKFKATPKEKQNDLMPFLRMLAESEWLKRINGMNFSDAWGFRDQNLAYFSRVCLQNGRIFFYTDNGTKRVSPQFVIDNWDNV